MSTTPKTAGAARTRGGPALFLRGLCLLLLGLGSASCDDSDPEGNGQEPSSALFVIRACRGSEGAPDGETFRVQIENPDVIAQADTLVGRGNLLIVTGELRAGDGGFNQPWSWHLDPATVGFAQFTIELCDGCPGMVEADLATWLETVGTYCPWTTEVEERIR